MEVGLAFLDLVFSGDPGPLDAWSVTWKPILAAAPVPFPVSSRRSPRRRQAWGSQLPAEVSVLA